MTQRLTRVLSFAFIASAILVSWHDAEAQSNATRTDAGKRAFEARCGGCHGADAAGGERGPTLVDIRQPRATTPAALRQLIRTGIPGTGMPAFQIADDELDALVSHLELLTMPASDRPSDGDASAGERFFAGKGNCLSCHMVRGKGSVLGPDLSNLGRERRTPQIERALREPAAGSGAVSVRLRDGRRFRGLVRYESPFDMGVQTIEGSFESIAKDRIEAITREPSLMPRVEAPPEEMRDLLAYLTRLSVDRSARATLIGTAAAVERFRFEEIAAPEPGEWPTYHGRLSGNRHSVLDQINLKNIDSSRARMDVSGARRARRIAGDAGRARRLDVCDGR